MSKPTRHPSFYPLVVFAAPNEPGDHMTVCADLVYPCPKFWERDREHLKTSR